MGRAEHRKKHKVVKQRMSDEQFKILQGEINQEFIENEVKNQIGFYQELFTECLTEAFKNNGITNTRANMILDDVKTIMIRKVEEKKHKKRGAKIV
ncbi:MAG: hypothetical protein ACRC7N_21300 [Clostridium sp.]